MAKTVQEAYGEIVRLRNEAYKKWMELLQPVVIPNTQKKSNDGYITRNS